MFSSVSGGSQAGSPFKKSQVAFVAAALIIIILSVYLRTTLLNYHGFFEPDGFYHFAVVRYAVNHGFSIPSYLGISGWPSSAPVAEPDGLYWTTLLPYAILQSFGVSYYTIMRLVPVLFGILDVIGAYYMSRFISRDRVFGLLVMTLVALSAANASRTMALSYRGDDFVSIFLITALICVGMAINEKRGWRRFIYALLGAAALSVCNLVWNGASFAVAVYALALVLIAAYAFVAGKEDILRNMAYVLVGFFVWFALVQAYTLAGYIHGQQYQAFTGIDFVAVPVALLAAWIVMWLTLRKGKANGMVSTAKGRVAIIASMLIVGLAVFYVFAYGFLFNTLAAEGLTHAHNSLLSSIQELSVPNFAFLFASFNITLFMSPAGIFMAISSVAPGYMMLFFAFLVAGSLIYLFVRIYDSGEWLNGRPGFTLDINPSMLMLVAYLFVTAYLQMTAERFSSLLSLPFVIFTAYTLYLIILVIKKRFRNMPAAIVNLTIGVTVVAILVIILHYDLLLAPQTPSDAISPYLLNATAWLSSNTPSNSVVLTLWQDGSVVEGWGNRTSVTDSVGAQNIGEIQAFALWLLNDSNDARFLYKTSDRPGYLLTRELWTGELGSIFTESGMNTSTLKNYSIEGLSVINSSFEGAVSNVEFSGQGVRAYISMRYENVSSGFFEYNSIVENTAAPLKYISLYNTENGNFTIQKNTAYNNSKGWMLLVMYSRAPASPEGIASNIIGAILMSPDMAASNFVKLVYFCNNYQCIWNNDAASMQLVYPNSQTSFNQDTRIYKIIYNGTANG